jgi:hypothetical protein
MGRKGSRPRSRAVLLWSTALTLVLLGAPLRADDGAAPKPIPGGLGRTPDAPEGVGIHFFPPAVLPTGELLEPSTITDFNGVVAVAQLQGTGEATDTSTGLKYPAAYEIDMRLYKGRYVGVDGVERDGTFAFI